MLKFFIAKLIVLIAMMFAVGVAVSSEDVFAAGVDTLSHKLNESLDSIETKKSDWIKSHSDYSTAVSAAEGKWISHYSKVSFKGEASSGDINEIQYDKENIGDVDLYAVTYRYYRSDSKVPTSSSGPISDWDYSVIRFNTYYCEDFRQNKQTLLTKIAVHEIGHAFGLAHNTNGTGDEKKGLKNYIMYYATNSTTDRPHSDEFAALNKKYYPNGSWKKVNACYWHFGSDGYPEKGWSKISGNWYYFNTSFNMQVGWQHIKQSDGNYYWYWFGTDPDDGKMRTSWQHIKQSDGKYYWYWFGSSPNDGKMRTSWQKILQSDGNYYWYYFGTGSIEGRMQIGWQHRWQSDGNYYWYYFGSSPNDGKMKTSWQKIQQSDGNYYWYYFGTGSIEGRMQIGWQHRWQSDGNYYWYYFGSSENDGRMKRGWQTIGGWLFYFGPGENDGRMRTGWQKPASSWYYMRTALNVPGTGPWGATLRNGTWTIDNKAYRFDSDGVCLNR